MRYWKSHLRLILSDCAKATEHLRESEGELDLKLFPIRANTKSQYSYSSTKRPF